MKHFFTTRIRVVLIVAVLIAAILAVVSSITDMSLPNMMVQGVLTPIRTGVSRLTDQAERIAAGDFSSPANIGSNDEIGVLSQTFDEMSSQLATTLRQVEEEKNKLGTLFQHMADGMVAFDGHGQLLQFNPAAEVMLGKKLEESLHYSDVFPDVQVQPDDLAQDGKSIEIDFAAGPRFLKIYFAPIRLGMDNKGLMAVLHDITE